MDIVLMDEVELEIYVTKIMLEMGVPAHLKGYHYLRTAIIMSGRDMEIVSSVTKLLYPEVAKKYHYTCLNTTGVCDSVMYITKYDATTVFGIMLNQGDKIDDAKRKMLDEKNDSTIKNYLVGGNSSLV